MQQLIARGTCASVYKIPSDRYLDQQHDSSTRQWLAESGSTAGFLAAKVMDDDAAVVPPHDVFREVKLLQRIGHPNIVPLLLYERDELRHGHNLIFPRYPITLTQVLDNPYFVPVLPSSAEHPILETAPLPSHDPLAASLLTLDMSRAKAFNLLASGIAYQVLSALTYLHELDLPIAHRDIKPSNIMLDDEGNVRLIDFGIAVDGAGHEDRSMGLRAEGLRCRTLQVGSGAYRAPELLFGAETYCPFALDIWAAGVTIASLFTPLRFGLASASNAVDIDLFESYGEGERGLPPFTTTMAEGGSSNEEDSCSGPGIVTLRGDKSRLTRQAKMGWTRQCLFEGGLGEIALVWSIFRVKGTPTQESWPSFERFPDSRKISFFPARCIPLSRLLPFCQDIPNEDGSIDTATAVLNTLEGMLDYCADRRASSRKCLNNVWPTSGGVIDPQWTPSTRRSMMTGFLLLP